MRPYAYSRPTTAVQALETAGSNDKARYLGGGTNLLDLMKEDVERPDAIVEVADLDYQSVTANANGS